MSHVPDEQSVEWAIFRDCIENSRLTHPTSPQLISDFRTADLSNLRKRTSRLGQISNLKSENLETFSVYKFSIGYPPVCRVEFNPKSRRQGGDIVFHFPDKEKIYLSWGDLEVAKKRFQTPENQAEEGIKRIMKGRTVNMKESQRVAQESLKVNTHKAVYNRVKLGEMLPGLFFSKKRIVSREALSVHLHCEDSSRYFVIYSLLSPNAPEDFGTLLLAMARSFKCH